MKLYTTKARLSNQRGAILIIGMIMLLIVTIIGISGMQSVTLDEKIVSNMQNATLAYHGAEAGLAHCESNVQAHIGKVFNLGSFPVGWRDNKSVWEKASEGAAVDYTGLKQQPLCVVEYVGNGSANVDVKETYNKDSSSSRPTFRVTSYSQGGNSFAEAMLESVFICPGGCNTRDAIDYGDT